MIIECRDNDQFVQMIYSLAIRGLGFKADAGNLRITLTGAF